MKTGEQHNLAKQLEANKRFNKELKEYLAGRLNDQVIFYLGNSFGNLSKKLDNHKGLYMRQGILSKATKGHDTSIDLKQLKDLPLKLSHASTIFRSKKHGALVAVIDVADSKRQPVVVAIQTRHAAFIGQTPEGINVITSIHGRPKEQLMHWKVEGLELGKGGKINSAYIQFGAIPNRYVNGDLNNATKISQENQNSKSLAKKMNELTQKNTEVLRGQHVKHRHKGKGY